MRASPFQGAQPSVLGSSRRRRAPIDRRLKVRGLRRFSGNAKPSAVGSGAGKGRDLGGKGDGSHHRDYLNRMDPSHDQPPPSSPATPKLTPEERRGHALVELIDRFPLKKLPRLGGSAPAVVVTMDLETLVGGLRAAHLDTGQVISPGAARRLAAQAGVIPAVLGSDGEVLDLGSRHRFQQRQQRLALVVQQRGTCAVRGCTRSIARPAAMQSMARALRTGARP